MTAAIPLLSVDHLTMRFGGLVAVDDVSFEAEARRITALIGPNGAGKTTVFNCLTGFYPPSSGMMRLCHDGGEFLLERMEGFRIAARAGVARTFQNIRLFRGMSVLENLIVAQHNGLMRASGYTVAALLGFPAYRHAQRDKQSALYPGVNPVSGNCRRHAPRGGRLCGRLALPRSPARAEGQQRGGRHDRPRCFHERLPARAGPGGRAGY